MRRQQLPPSDCNVLEKQHPTITAAVRMVTVSWMAEVVEVMLSDMDELFSAVALFDEYLGQCHVSASSGGSPCVHFELQSGTRPIMYVGAQFISCLYTFPPGIMVSRIWYLYPAAYFFLS